MNAEQHRQRPRSAPPAHRIHKLTDAEKQGLVQEWANVEVHQLDAGSFKGVCTTLSAGSIHLVHEQQNRLVHKSGMLPRNACTVSMSLSNDPAMRFSHLHAPGSSQVFFLPGETEFDIQVPGGTDTLYICLDQDKLTAGARVLDKRFWEQAPDGLSSFNNIGAGKLAADFLALLDSPQRLAVDRQESLLSPQVETLLLDSVLLALANSTCMQPGDIPAYQARRRAHRRVSAAREFMEASLQAGRVPSLVDICAHTGASVRSLQYAFHDVMQLTPVAYLRILRLNKVRRQLQSASTADITVTRVATNWGFAHLGEFARDYRRLFSELPSDSLSRSLADHCAG